MLCKDVSYLVEAIVSNDKYSGNETCQMRMTLVSNADMFLYILLSTMLQVPQVIPNGLEVGVVPDPDDGIPVGLLMVMVQFDRQC
jgi:hypothetical protein